jgi:hypothetical protein
MGQFIKIGFEARIALLKEKFDVLIVLANKPSNFLAFPLEFVDADTEATNLSQKESN